IHYIWSLTVHRTWNYFIKYKLLNNFSHQQIEQSCDFSRALVKACRRSSLSALGGCKTPDLCLDSADWPCAYHMHSPKRKKLL
ncbi:unnamed protein product, partial [Staurois parvus]